MAMNRVIVKIEQTPYSKIKLPQFSQNSRWIDTPDPLSETCSFGFPSVSLNASLGTFAVSP